MGYRLQNIKIRKESDPRRSRPGKMKFINAIAFIVTIAMALPADAPLATSVTSASEPEGGRGGEGPCCRPCGGGVSPHYCCYC